MCIFSANANVADTKIFARRAASGGQFLVYSMRYEAEQELAMILPLPTPESAREDAVRFIDLSGYPTFFEDLDDAFPKPRGGRSLALRTPLAVHDVGSFEASFVPTLADFDRLDPRFRLPGTIWDSLPRYATYGFAVFKLKPGAKDVHPMALEMETREPGRLFFPTVHVHDGSISPEADFDHALYCQCSGSSSFWEPAKVPPALTLDRTAGIVVPGETLLRAHMHGTFLNEDVWFTEP